MNWAIRRTLAGRHVFPDLAAQRQGCCRHAQLIPRKDLVEAWRDLEDNAKDLAKRLTGKEAATPSRTWKLLSEARPEMTLFLAVTASQQAVVAEDQEFLHQVAASAAKDSAAGDDRAAHHAAVAGVFQDCSRCIHAAAGWQTALADRDIEVPEAAGAAAATAATPASAEARTGSQSRCCQAAAAAAATVPAARGKKKGKGKAPPAVPAAAKPATAASRSSGISQDGCSGQTGEG